MVLEYVCAEAVVNVTERPRSVTLRLPRHHVSHATIASVNSPYLGVFPQDYLEQARVNVAALRAAVQLTKRVIDVLQMTTQGCVCAGETRYVHQEVRLSLV